MEGVDTTYLYNPVLLDLLHIGERRRFLSWWLRRDSFAEHIYTLTARVLGLTLGATVHTGIELEDLRIHGESLGVQYETIGEDNVFDSLCTSQCGVYKTIRRF